VYVGQRVVTDYFDKNGDPGLVVGLNEDGRWNVLVSGTGRVYPITADRLKPAPVEDRFGIDPVYVLNQQPGITKDDIKSAVFWGNLGAALVIALVALALYILSVNLK
jgi:hypothetical protein